MGQLIRKLSASERAKLEWVNFVCKWARFWTPLKLVLASETIGKHMHECVYQSKRPSLLLCKLRYPLRKLFGFSQSLLLPHLWDAAAILLRASTSLEFAYFLTLSASIHKICCLRRRLQSNRGTLFTLASHDFIWLFSHARAVRPAAQCLRFQ